jgi:polyisoprenoid-binding protein YceI
MLMAVPAVLAWRAPATVLTLQPQSKIWIAGTSTVRSFECKATAFDAAVETTGPGAASLVASGEKAVLSVGVSVPAGKMDCANGKMNEHMLKALKADEHPVISFKLASYDLTKASDGAQVSLAGSLTLGGSEKPISLTAVAKEEEKGLLHVTGSYELNMKEFGLKPPTLMLGTLKVGERVKVNFDLFLKD